jgi:N-methylhydantoinase A
LSAYKLPPGRTDILVSADMRYLGQAYEINVPLPSLEFDEAARLAIIESFHQAHERIYGRRHAEGSVQFVNILLTVIGRVQAVRHAELGKGEGAPTAIMHARTWFRGQPFDNCPCYDRNSIRAGHRWQGPAVVAGQDSTIVVPPGWDAVCDAFGNLLITRAGEKA